MTPNAWTHAICDSCYQRRWFISGWSEVPHRVVDPNRDRQPFSEACCWCGLATRGIYVRADPLLLHTATN